MARKKSSSSKSKSSSEVSVDNQQDVNDDDSMNDQYLPYGEEEQRPVSKTTKENDNRMRKKKKDKSSTRKKKRKSQQEDPSGYSTMKNEEMTLYKDDELNPLRRMSSTAKSGSGGYSKSIVVDDNEAEECELLDDTFTFLMTGNYPFEHCLCSQKLKHQLGKDQEQEDQQNQNQLENEYEMDELIGDYVLSKKPLNNQKNQKSTRTIKAKNPDKYNLPFWLGSFVIFSQVFIYTIVIANVFNQELPPGADTWLRLAQYFAVIVTLYTQSDFIDGIFLFTERWKAFKDVTGPIKFNISALCRVLIGNVGIAATFILVMYSEEVVDLLLNFTAMEFVATLDDSAFELAAKGFLGGTLERKTELIRAFRYKPRHHLKRRRARCFMYFLYIVLVFTSFFVILGLQRKRSVGVDNEVYIQFDDTDLPELYGVSGVYKGCTGFRTKETTGIGYIEISLDCPEFEEKGGEDKTLPGKSFVYCNKLEGWVYLPIATSEPCKDESFLMRSFLDEEAIPSNAFDILTHSKANWVIGRPAIGNEAMLSNFVIESVQNIPSRFVNCNGAGLLRSDKATSRQKPFEPLDDKFYSLYDDLVLPFDIDDGDTTTATSTYSVFGQIFRPIFVRKVYKDVTFQVVLFDGLRWNRIYLNPSLFASHIGKEKECESNKDDDPNCWKIFARYFRTESSWRTDPSVVFFDGISDPMIILTPADTGVPTQDLRWYQSRLVNGNIIPGQPLAGFDPRTIKGFVDPSVQELCPILDDYQYYYDYLQSVAEETDGEVPPLFKSVFEMLDNLCVGDNSGVEKACNSLPGLEFGEDYDYAYDYYLGVLGCNNEDDEDDIFFGFECDLSTQFQCNDGETKLQINFPTDFSPEDYTVLVFSGQNASIVDKGVTDRTFVTEQTKDFSIPSEGIAEFRFIESNTEHLLSTCVPNEPKQCIQVVILDSGCDGTDRYEISYGDDIPTVGGGPGDDFSCRPHQFGRSCVFEEDDTSSGEGFGPGSGSGSGSGDCSYYDIKDSIPLNVTGDKEIPKSPSKTDVFVKEIEDAATFAVTADGWVTSPPITSPPVLCLEDEIGLKIDVTTDDYYYETVVAAFIGQELNDSFGFGTANELSLSSASEDFDLSADTLAIFKFPFQETFSLVTCIPADTPCVQVVMLDQFGDGFSQNGFYAITYDDLEPLESERGYWDCRLYQFGDGCVNPLESLPISCSIDDLALPEEDVGS